MKNLVGCKRCLYVQKSSISNDYTQNRNYQLICWWGFSLGHILSIAFHQNTAKAGSVLLSLTSRQPEPTKNLYIDKGRVWINQAFTNYLHWVSQSSQESQKCIQKYNIFTKLKTIQTGKLTFWILNTTPILGNELHIHAKRQLYR